MIKRDIHEYAVRLVVSIIGLAVLLWADVERARSAPPGPPGAAQVVGPDKDWFATRTRLLREARGLRDAGRLAEASTRIGQALDLTRGAPGDRRAEVARLLDDFATSLEESGQFGAARKARREAVDVHVRLYGDRDWHVTDARFELAETDRLEAMTQDQRRQLIDLARVRKTMHNLFDRRFLTEAVVFARRAADACERLFGERHPANAQALNDLGAIEADLGEIDHAEPHLRRALSLRRELLGEGHPLFRQSQVALAALLQDRVETCKERSDLDGARKAAEERLALRVAIYGPDHWRSSNARLDLEDLATYRTLDPEARKALRDAAANALKVYELWKSGRSKEALPLAEGVANCRRRILGARHRDYAMGLFNLAAQHQALREFDRAEALYLQALAIIKERLGERHPDTLLCMHNLGQLYHDRGDDDRAESLLGETLKKRKEVIGVDHDDYATTRDTLIGIMGQRIHDAKDRADFEAARQVQQRLVKLLIELFTIDDWRVADARLAAIDLERLTRLGKDDRDRLRKATESSRESDRLWNSGKLQDALKVGEGVAESRRRILGEHNPDYALSLRDLADRHQNLREFNRAETLYLQALAIFKERLGQGYHDRAARPDGIDGLAEEFGDLDSTETDFRTSGSSREKVGGGSALDYALTLTRLGYLYERMGDYARAVPADREALDVFRRLDGENHANYAATLNNLAMLYQDMGDYAQAEPLLRQACDLSRDSRFISPLMYAVNLNNLGSLYNYIGEYALAEPLHRECAEVRKAVLGEKHPDYAQSLDNLAFMYSQMEDDARAEPLFRKASEIYRAANGHDSPDYAINLQNLAWISLRRGDFAEADRLSQESLSIFKKAVGEKHEYYHAGLSLHSRVREAVGDAGEAEQIARQSLELRRRHLELTAAVQSERQQLVMAGDLRSALDRYLSLAIPLRLNGDQVYPYVLAWKGLVLARQRALREAKRIAHKNGDAEARRLGSALDEVSSKLARLALSTDDPAEAHAGRSEVQRLTLEMERLEGELAGRSASFRKFEELLKLKPDQIKQVLPGDATLVDLLVYSRFSPSHLTKGRMTSRQHIVAFVIRPGRPVEMVPLGPAEPIDRAVESWRAGYGRADDNDDPGAELRRLVWRRWEKQVAGARTVLISPDGSLARLPFPALPGGVPGKYLIEELSVAVVPVPLLLPELLGAAPPSEGKSEPPSLLLVGDVSYDTSPGKGSQGVSRMAARDGMLGTFSQLQGTREEIEALGTLFVKRYPGLHPDVLRGERATETLFRTEAPRHRWVHLATHGFFAPEQLHSALAPDRDAENTVRDIFGHQGVDGINPGLLSGIVLSGVNRRGGYGDDDGILTALEVAALDLGDLELGTLSACETGLGTMAGGEGLLGLQRAFQVAGARTVVASFWKVNDRATQAFMRRFYANLWRDKQPLGKLEALREAQLWMMREGDRLPSEGRQSSPAPPSSPPTPTRDLEPLPEPVTREGGPRQPYFWAAFMLSGDWR